MEVIMNFEKALELLSYEQLQDCERRGMLGSVKQIKTYLWELEEVRKADERLKLIDLEVEKKKPGDRAARERRINAQRDHFLSMVYELKYSDPVEDFVVEEETPQSIERSLAIQKAFYRFTKGDENKGVTMIA
jgi:hypothetical protein